MECRGASVTGLLTSIMTLIQRETLNVNYTVSSVIYMLANNFLVTVAAVITLMNKKNDRIGRKF